MLARAGRKVTVVDANQKAMIETQPTVIVLANHDKDRQRIRNAIAEAGALPLDVQQLEAVLKLASPALNMLRDGAFQLGRLEGGNLEAYARTWAALAKGILEK